MPPTTALATLRPELTGLMREWSDLSDEFGYIAFDVLPSINVGVKSDEYGVLPIEELKKQRPVNRAPRGPFSRSMHDFTKQTFDCQEYGHEEPVDHNLNRYYENFEDAEAVAGDRCREIILNALERRVADAVFDTSVWTGGTLTTGVSTEWSTHASATPISDVSTAKKKVRASSGMMPNAGICSWTVFENLRQCTDIHNRVSASGAGDKIKPGDLSVQMVAAALGLDRLLVGGAMKDTAAVGQDASLADVWDDEYFMVCRVATGSDIQETCIGRTFHYNRVPSMPEGIVETYEEPAIDSTVVRVRHHLDEVIHYAEVGHLLSNITA